MKVTVHLAANLSSRGKLFIARGAETALARPFANLSLAALALHGDDYAGLTAVGRPTQPEE